MKQSDVSKHQLLDEIKSSLLFKRQNAAATMGILQESSDDVVIALLVAKESDIDDEVKKAASSALEAPIHQRYVQEHPEIIEMAALQIKMLELPTKKQPSTQSYFVEDISDFFKNLYDNLPEFIQIPLGLFLLLAAIVLIVGLLGSIQMGAAWLWTTLITNPLAFGIGALVTTTLIIGLILKFRKSANVQGAIEKPSKHHATPEIYEHSSVKSKGEEMKEAPLFDIATKEEDSATRAKLIAHFNQIRANAEFLAFYPSLAAFKQALDRAAAFRCKAGKALLWATQATQGSEVVGGALYCRANVEPDEFVSLIDVLRIGAKGDVAGAWLGTPDNAGKDSSATTPAVTERKEKRWWQFWK